MKFTKMQGCGNDYVYVNGMNTEVKDKPTLVKLLSDRHFGIGGDGVIFINDSAIADFEMEMYNADGSRSQMCGNGIRCVGKYVYDKGLTKNTSITVESYGQIKYLDLRVENGKVKEVSVDMGEPILKGNLIPVACNDDLVLNHPVTVGAQEFKVNCVSMGNPHAVIFVDEITDDLVLNIGKQLEVHEFFPERVNVEFVKVIDDSNVEMRVWERGTGETLACGTGCCATAVSCILNEKTSRNVNVHVVGGVINIAWDEETNHITMTGPAVTVFEGEI